MTIQRHDAGGKAPKAKQPYSTPTLTTYGSVRELTGGSSHSGMADGGFTMHMSTHSEPALKENIVLIDRHPAGFGLYLFDYKPQYAARCGRGRQFGVMADEVEAIFPDAVARDEFGFRTVDYARLGITLD